MYTVRNGTIVSQQLTQMVCRAEVGAVDRRKNRTIETFTIFFDVRSDYDGSDGYIKVTCSKILNNLGYNFTGPLKWDIREKNVDAEEMFDELSD